MANRPTIVCLCGSTRFYEAFQRANFEETMAGKIVLSVGFYPHAQDEMHGEDVGVTPEQKAALPVELPVEMTANVRDAIEAASGMRVELTVVPPGERE